MHILYICRNIYSTPLGILYFLYYNTIDFVINNDYLHTPWSDQDTDMWFLLNTQFIAYNVVLPVTTAKSNGIIMFLLNIVAAYYIVNRLAEINSCNFDKSTLD